MSRGPVLLPNLGAEEGPRHVADRSHPILRDVTSLWALLFSDRATMVGDLPIAWPPALEPRSGAPAFPWVEDRARGIAWLSTRSAWDELRELGAAPAMPTPAIVERVHDKAFALEVALERELVPSCLREHLEILDPLELRTGVATDRIADWIARLPPWVHGSWTIKPRIGSSGRGRIGGRLAEPSAEGPMDGAASGLPRTPPRALARLGRRGGAILEPWLDRRVDLSTQLHIARSGVVEILGTTRQLLSPAGVYLGSRGILGSDGACDSGSPFDGALRSAALRLGAAAADAGFFGACGVDAFTFAGPGGEETLRPVVELNARFTMGTIALGLLQRAREAGLLDVPSAWIFSLRAPTRPAEGVLRLPLGDRAALLLAPTEAALDTALASA